MRTASIPALRLARPGDATTSTGTRRVLVVHGDAVERERLLGAVGQLTSFAPVASAAGADDLPAVAADVALVDARAPEVVRELQAMRPPVECVAVTGHDARDTMAALAAGACACVPAGAVAARLATALRDASAGEVRLPRVLSRWLFTQALDGSPAPSMGAQPPAHLVFAPVLDLRLGRLAGVQAVPRFDGRDEDAVLEAAALAGRRAALELDLARSAIAVLERLPRPVFVEVAVSAATLLEHDVASLVPEASGDRIVLGVTRLGGTRDLRPLAAALASLRARGVRVAVDDSGEGLHSLARLAELRPDLLRLPAAVVRDVHRAAARRALVAAAVEVARDLGASVVAEGVGNEAELRALDALGVALGQGPHLGRPAPADQLIHGLLAPAVPAPAAPAALEGLPPAARVSLRRAIPPVFAVLQRELPGTAVALCHHDRDMGRLRLVHVEAGPVEGLEPGWSAPLDDDLAAGLGAGSEAWVPLPLAGAEDAAFVLALAPDRDRFGPAEVELLTAAAEVLASGLRAELGPRPAADAEARLRELGCTDPVTGADNRATFLERLAPHAAGALLLRLGIDDVEGLRRDHGQAATDLVLKTLATHLAEHAAGGTRAGRVATGELAAVLPTRDEVAANRLARRVVDDAQRALAARGVRLGVRARVEPADGASPPGAWLGAPPPTPARGSLDVVA